MKTPVMRVSAPSPGSRIRAADDRRPTTMRRRDTPIERGSRTTMEETKAELHQQLRAGPPRAATHGNAGASDTHITRHHQATVRYKAPPQSHPGRAVVQGGFEINDGQFDVRDHVVAASWCGPDHHHFVTVGGSSLWFRASLSRGGGFCPPRATAPGQVAINTRHWFPKRFPSHTSVVLGCFPP